ncbi:hypothetical protein GCM10010448_59170 [Streptomyces glomeratus]|uniref:HTH cro/C1-type domain-containing protein n=1 Tax=Streptomyces glomeratus TaxID=284452 RepID=A0ABP6M2W6_9ACTN
MPDPRQIHTRDELIQQLAELFHSGGWSIQRLAATAGLGRATVQGVINGATDLPRSGTLKAFVEACGQKPEPWLEARARLLAAARQARSGSATSQVRDRQAREFWPQFTERDLTVVVGLHQLTGWEPSGFIGVGDAFALSELQQHFIRIGAPSPLITYSDRLDSPSRRNPLILIGGPDGNGITNEVMQRLVGHRPVRNIPARHGQSARPGAFGQCAPARIAESASALPG